MNEEAECSTTVPCIHHNFAGRLPSILRCTVRPMLAVPPSPPIQCGPSRDVAGILAPRAFAERKLFLPTCLKICVMHSSPASCIIEWPHGTVTSSYSARCAPESTLQISQNHGAKASKRWPDHAPPSQHAAVASTPARFSAPSSVPHRNSTGTSTFSSGFEPVQLFISALNPVLPSYREVNEANDELWNKLRGPEVYRKEEM